MARPKTRRNGTTGSGASMPQCVSCSVKRGRQEFHSSDDCPLGKKRKGSGKHPGSLLLSNKLVRRPAVPSIESNIDQQVVDTQQPQTALGTTIAEDSLSELDPNLDPNLNNYFQPSTPTPLENPPTVPVGNGLSGAQLIGSEVYNTALSDGGTPQLLESINGIVEALMPSSGHATAPENDCDGM